MRGQLSLLVHSDKIGRTQVRDPHKVSVLQDAYFCMYIPEAALDCVYAVNEKKTRDELPLVVALSRTSRLSYSAEKLRKTSTDDAVLPRPHPIVSLTRSPHPSLFG